MDAGEFATRNWQITCVGCAGCQQHRIAFLCQFLRRHRAVLAIAYLGVDDELHAFVAHLLHATLNHILLEFHVGNAVHQQSADAIRALIHSDLMANARELLSSGQA